MQSTTLYNDVSKPAVPLTVGKLLELLSKLPKDAKVTIYSDPETDGEFYVQFVSHDAEKNRVLLQGPDASNANDCEKMDQTGQWHHY